MTGPGMSATVPAGRSFQRWMPNAASTVGASRTPSRIIASAPFEISSAGWNASFTLPGRNAACSRRATSSPMATCPSCRRRSAPYSRAVGAAPPPTRWCAAPRTPARGAGVGRGGWRSDPSGRWGGACSYAGTRTQPVYYTNLALRPPRDTHATPVPDQRVREPGPLVARHECHQVPFDLHRVPLFRQAEQRRKPLNVGVDHDAFVLPEPGAEHDVRGFAAHTGELDQLLHGVGYRASMALDQRLRHPDDGFGLVAEEPRAVDLLLQDLRVGARIVLRRAILREQRRGDQVDPRVGGLCRQDGGDQQLERARVLQRAGRVGIGLLETGDDLADPRPPLGLRLVARAPGRWGFCLRGHQPAATSRARANARNASASRVFRTWSGSSQPLRAIPRPTATLAMPLVEWASAPIEQVTPSSRARRTMRQSRSRRCGSAFTSTAMPRAAALASTCSRSIAYGSRCNSSRPVG